MDYTEFYYSHVLGYYPSQDDEYKIKTGKVIDYLKDAGISRELILKVIEESPAEDYMSPRNLPDWLWEGSLLKRDTFYYHHKLHIKPDLPTFNPHTRQERVEKFFIEMLIQYRMEDLCNYYYKTLKPPMELIDKKRDAGSFNFLLEKYSRINIVESIDFVLSLIDYAKKNESLAFPSILGLAQVEQEVYAELKGKVPEATFIKANEIVWR